MSEPPHASPSGWRDLWDAVTVASTKAIPGAMAVQEFRPDRQWPLHLRRSSALPKFVLTRLNQSA